jgi:predicted transcriptional regulator of viral defense system
VSKLDLPETFTAAEAERLDLSRRQLARLQATGTVERIGRGLYRRADAELVDLDLLEIAIKAHRPTLCLVSALARHELTDIIPAEHDVAVPRGAWLPAVAAPVRWHKFDIGTFDIGRTEIPIDGTHLLGLYDPPRSIVDAFRMRHAIGPEIATEAVRRWLRRGGQPAKLIRMASAFPTAKPALLHTLQVLL